MGAKPDSQFSSWFYSSFLRVRGGSGHHGETEELFNPFPSIVSFSVAYMVACQRKYRYRKFQRRRKAGGRAEEPAVGTTGV